MGKSEYLSNMKENNWYWQQDVTNQSIIISTRTIFHTCIEVSDFKECFRNPQSICNKNKNARLSRDNHFFSDADHDYIIDEVQSHDHIEYERQIHNDDK